MKELYNLLKKIKEDHGVEVNILISVDDEGLHISDFVNANDKEHGGISVGGGLITPGGGADFDTRYKTFLKAIEVHFNNELPGLIDGVGSYKMDFDTLHSNNFGAELKE